jgi:hypothetical protein
MSNYRFIRFTIGTSSQHTNWQPAEILENDFGLVRFLTIGRAEVYVKMLEEIEIGEEIKKENEY